MDLDMYLEGHKMIHYNTKEMEDGFRVSEHILELGYWRKHPNLHGYISLDRERLDNIITAVKTRKLPATTGFFFGTSNNSAEQQEEDLSILTKAKEWLETASDDGTYRYVIYRASW